MRLAKRLVAILSAVGGIAPSVSCAEPPRAAKHYAVEHSDAEWHKLLTPAQYDVLRARGTERPYGRNFHDAHEHAVYLCAACGAELFRSDEKFDSGTGWPSFWQPAAAKAIETEEDRSYGMTRTEVRCARCGGHLGHVFEDGPKPTGLRYCINGVALVQRAVKP
jgi:peptide-methionine (R)-S-oxide reductase